MDLDCCQLEKPPLGVLQQLRQNQIRAYRENEKTLRERKDPYVLPLRRKSQKVHFSPSDILRDAIVRHDHNEVLGLLKDGAAPDTTISSRGSLLHLCSRHDNALTAELLISRGVDVDAEDEDLQTALHVACTYDSSDVLRLLLQAGANVFIQDIWENVPLDCTTVDTESRRVLLQYIKKLNVDKNALQLSKSQRSAAMLEDIQQLIANGTSLNQPGDGGVTLLHIACAQGYKDVTCLLLQNGACPQVEDDDTWTPLHLAAKYGQTHLVVQLLRWGANPTLLNQDGKKASDIAASTHIADILQHAGEHWKSQSPTRLTNFDGCILAENTENWKNCRSSWTLPMSKHDSLLEKATLFGNTSVSQQPSPDGGSHDAFTVTTNELEQVNLGPSAPSDDLASLSELKDSSLLYEMQKRFGNDQIYTYVGHILLLINPYKQLPIYSTLVSKLYLSTSGSSSNALPPHIFSSAERAFHCMVQERRPQCFVFSGESGSGKSMAFQHIVKHLVTRSGSGGIVLETKMKHVNCILEAFGHAETEINKNSSRFMKHLSLLYSEQKNIIRARLHTYVLEKSRLTCPPESQRNFAVFYQLAYGMPVKESSDVYLEDMLSHRYLSHTVPREPTGDTGSRDSFLALKHALQAVGFSGLAVENLFMILSAILHVGELSFSSPADADTASVSNPIVLDRVSGMLQVLPEDLESALTSDVQFVKGDVITRRLTVEMSHRYRDLLAKTLYGRLFGHLVNEINRYLDGREDHGRNSELEIGIVDIYGFAQFGKNGFEQLCINMANEKIHQFITDVLFRQEEADCRQEGIALEDLYTPTSHCSVLDFFFQVPQGLFSGLDEESQAQQSVEQNLSHRLQAQQDAGAPGGVFLTTKDGNGNLPAKSHGLSFTITHYAGKITYDLTGSLQKNQDALPQSLLFLMKSSDNVIIRQAFQSKLMQTGRMLPPRRGLGARRAKTTGLDLKHVDVSEEEEPLSYLHGLDPSGPSTLSVQLRNSLSELITRLQACSPHVIHCVRPNSIQKPNFFDSLHVSSQLHNAEVLETVRMIRHGYPVRLTFTSFLTRFKNLAATTVGEKKLSTGEMCCHVLRQCRLHGWQVGRSKVFLKFWQVDHLSDQCLQLQGKITTCQKGLYKRVPFVAYLHGAVVRGWLARRRFKHIFGDHQQDSHQAHSASKDDRHQSVHFSGVLAGKRDANTGSKVRKGGAGRGCILKHFRSNSLSIPSTGNNMVHSPFTLSINKSPLLQTMHPTASEGGGGGGTSAISSPRKQPPPKPKRDPNTRLSASYEASCAPISISPQNTLEDVFKARPHSDDYSIMKKTPPPKPIRSPNTKLTGSFEEISLQNNIDARPYSSARGLHSIGLVQRASSVDRTYNRCRQEEDVYIEMVASSRTTNVNKVGNEEPGEAVYEEMNHLSSEEGITPVKFEGSSQKLITKEPLPLQCPSGSKTCDIPSPFPNLLPHRPPLLVFPPASVMCSPAMDESPLSPLDVQKLPVLETNLNYSSPGEECSPLSPKCARQRADSLFALGTLMQGRSTPPLSPPPIQTPPAKRPLPYNVPSTPPFSENSNPLSLSWTTSVTTPPKRLSRVGSVSVEAPPASEKIPFSPVKKNQVEPRRAQSCCSSPLLFNHANARHLPNHLDELSNLLDSGRNMMKKSSNGSKIRDSERDDPGMSILSHFQDKNANNHRAASPTHIENGNQLSNGSLEDEGQQNHIASNLRHMDRNQMDQMSLPSFSTGPAL